MQIPVRRQRSWPTSLGAPVAAPRRHRCRLSRGIGKLALMIPIIAVMAGCSAVGDVDNSDNNVILRIEAIVPDEEANVWGDVLTDEGGIPSDVGSFTFSASLKAPVSTDPTATAPVLQDIALDRYEVTFTRTDGGTAVPPGFTRGISGLVRLTELGATEPVEFTVNDVAVVPATVKLQQPISFLIDPGVEPGTNFANIQVNARIQFFGRTISGNEVTVVANWGIDFTNWADVEDETPGGGGN